MSKKAIAVLFATLFTQSILAAPNGPDMIMITLAGDGCPQNVREVGNGGMGNPKARCTIGGVKQSDAVCKASGNGIAWKLNGNPSGLASDPLTITVKEDDSSGGSVLSGCGWQPSDTNKQYYACTIKSSPEKSVYSYGITVNYTDASNDCHLDPRIIITNNLNKRMPPEGNQPKPPVVKGN